MKKILLGCLVAGSMGWSTSAIAQSDYPTLSQLNQRLQQIGSHASAQLKSLTKTAGGKDEHFSQ